LTKLSQSGKLNSKTYIPLIDQMKTANLKTVKELQAQNLTQEVERVKKRLQAVVNEEKDVQNNPSAALSGSTQAKSTSSTGSTSIKLY